MVALVAIGILLATIFNLNLAHLSLPEGASCEVEGHPGTCRLWKQCYTMVADHDNNQFPPVCSFKGDDPIICCSSCDTVEDITNAVVDPTGEVLWKTDQKSWNQCIDYYISAPYACKNNLSRMRKEWNASANCFGINFENYVDKKLPTPYITNGKDTTRLENPHMALLGRLHDTEMKQASINWDCGGTIISNRFIMTAGHCIAKYESKVKYAALGILNRSELKDVNMPYIYNITKIIPHPEYSSPSKYNDIALLETDRLISFNKYVLPACLPRLGVDASDDAEATGWGVTDYKKNVADILQMVSLKKFNETKCLMLYGKLPKLERGYDHSIQMCYGSEDEYNVGDTCTGDSGGPLHTVGQATKCQKTVIGVTSFGHGCGIRGSAGIYTRVSAYVPWIESIVWPELY